MFSEISSIRIEFAETPQNKIFCDSSLIPFRLSFVDIDYATLITKPSLSSLSLCLATVFRLHVFFAFCLKSKIIMRHVRNRSFKHCGNTKLSNVLVRGFREVGDVVVRIVDDRRVIIHRSILVELFGLITCVCI